MRRAESGEKKGYGGRGTGYGVWRNPEALEPGPRRVLRDSQDLQDEQD
jgi:hypothetical protein